jgi:predicted metal-binding membrane protein
MSASVGRRAAAAPGRTTSAARRRALPLLALASLGVAAWGTLAWWSASPYARYLGHEGWAAPAAFGALCASVPGGEVLVPALLHAGAWVLMVAAMMLPTTMPLVATVARAVDGRTDGDALLALVVAGYAAAWSAFGLAAHAADAGLHAAVARAPAVAGHAWAIGAAILAGAGLFQFSALKYRCLDRCRTPFAFVTARWHGRAPRTEALRIGLDHGLFCVGCCWALMLAMFVVGTASVGWMLALALAMAAEKNLPWGARVREPLGAALLGSAALLAAANLGGVAAT